MSAPEVAIAAGQLDVDEVLELVAREDLTATGPVCGELVGAGDELVRAFTATLVARPQTQHFLTTPLFLDAHRDQLGRTEQLIAEAEAAGRQRLVQMNEPIRLNLVRVIEGIQALEQTDGDDA